MSSSIDYILEEILMERLRQDAKWGANRELPAPLWHTILSEEVGECAEAVLQHDLKQHRLELIQVASVAIASIEAIDRELAKTTETAP